MRLMNDAALKWVFVCLGLLGPRFIILIILENIKYIPAHIRLADIDAKILMSHPVCGHWPRTEKRTLADIEGFEPDVAL